MKLEDQVCSLDLAKRLKELGVKQESLFYWRFYHWPSSSSEGRWALTETLPSLSVIEQENSAFTVAELLGKIPKIIENKGDEINSSYLRIFTDECISWCVAHDGIGYQLYYDNSDDPNLSNVLAKMLIKLIEQNIVKP